MNQKIKYPGNLHSHTDYSNFRLRDSINTVESLIDYAIELGHRGIAITEHETIGSSLRALRHYKKIKKDNPDFKLLLGNEIYLTRNGLNSQNFKSGEDYYYHFILVAKNERGHEQIRELSTRAWSHSYMARGMMRVPTYYQDLYDIIEKDRGNVIGTTACLGGLLGTQLLKYKDTKDLTLLGKVKKWIVQVNELFGQGNFFLEMQPSATKEQIFVNNLIVELSEELNVPYIISTDAHYLRKEDRLIHKAFLTAQQGDREVDDFYMSTYLMNTEDIYSYMEKHVGEKVIQNAFRNLNEIIDSCETYELEKPLRIPYLPQNPKKPSENLVQKWETKIPLIREFINSDYDSDHHLIAEILDQVDKKEEFQNEETYREIEVNLNAILESSRAMNVPWSAYLLNVKDYIDIIWEKADSLVGCGRGSGGGFLLLYILGITQMNPLKEKTKTFFWRFLNPERASVLDIDFDIESSKRAQIYEAFQKIYGENRISKVLTVRTEKAKSAIQTAFRGLGIDVDEALYVSSLIKSERGILQTLKQTFYGDEEEGIKPNQEFVRLMTEQYPEAWKIAQHIEGLINGVGSHAGGTIFVDEPFYKSTALMKTSSGDVVTQFDLHDAESVGLIKIDLLSVDAIDRLRVTIDLLIEYGYAERKNTLKETYEEIIGIYNLKRDDEEMWQLLWNHQVQSLFQMEQQSGVQAIELVKPKSVDELAILNSAIRLMPSEKGAEQPLLKFARFKEDNSLWDQEMVRYGLVKTERELLKPILSISYGLCIAQEQFMQLVQLPELGGHSLLWADRLRKAIAKKNPKEYDQLTIEFFQTVEDKKLSYALASYVWNILIAMNRGYGFNASHTLLYSLIGLQELNLAYKYPLIFWNTACLIVDSGGLETEQKFTSNEEEETIYYNSPELFTEIEEDDDDDEDDEEEEVVKKLIKKKPRQIDYGKIASAIGKYQQQGITILPPNINISLFTFSPNVEENAIHYGLSGITRVGEDLINMILTNRPYTSIEDFLGKVKTNKLQMISLIKAGAFDEFGGRVKAMELYVDLVSDKKKRLTLQNMRLLIDYKLLPETFDFEIRVYNFNKYLKKFKMGFELGVNNTALQFYSEYFDMDHLKVNDDSEILFRINAKTWDKYYQASMDKIRSYLKAHHDILLNKLNVILYNKMWSKYAEGNLSKWEMDSISHYSSEHELQYVDNISYNFKSFNELPEEPEVDYTFYKDGNPITLFKIERIAGTVLNRDKNKKLVTVLTTDGIAQIKIFGPIFAHYDRQISERDPSTGRKKVIEKSWFTRGNKIIVCGIRRGESFIAKKYARTPYKLVELIDKVNEDGTIETKSTRVGELE